MGNEKIPKIIHYCWFGNGEMTEKEQACIATWTKFCPDYTIMRWDESRFDVNSCRYTKEAAEAGKWSFVTDYVRLVALYEYGGFYFDTDVELLKSLEPLRRHKAFIGFEQEDRVNDGQGMGAVAHLEMVRELKDMYQELSFRNADGTLNLKECPQYRTEYLKERGLKLNGKAQLVGEMTIYPREYFCPKSFQTGKLTVTENTYSIHHFRGSWHTQKELRIVKGMQLVRRVFGVRRGSVLLEKFFDWKDRVKHGKK